MIKNADIICDLAWGDCGKGKVSSYLSKNKKYDYVARWAGGNNAGHTVYINDKKYKTHLIPCGIFHEVKSIIGPGCVLNVKSFFEEVEYLSKNGFDVSLIKVSPKTHIVKEEHIEQDKKKYFDKLGTTAKGIAPCYSDKMARVGLRAEDVSVLKDFLWDEELSGDILCEGAQGFYLDIDYGNYPYVTSSNTLPYSACSVGFSPKKIRDIWGVSKIYDTRSGVDPMFPNILFEDKDLARLGELGSEFGVTTGRKRKVNWLNLNYFLDAVKISGSNKVILNKCDIIERLGKFKLYFNDELLSFATLEMMQDFIKLHFYKTVNYEKGYDLRFSYHRSEL